MRFLLILTFFALAPLAHAAPPATNTVQDITLTEKAKVVSIVSQSIKVIPGTNTSQQYQTLSALIISGTDAGKTVTVENDYLGLAPGDVFFLTHESDGEDGFDQYAVSEPDRLPALGILLGIFILAVVIVGGWTGLRGLLALLASFVFIIYALLPGVLSGYNPALVAGAVASLIIVVSSYLTHGLNRTTTAAVLGMIATIAITAVIAIFAVNLTKLSGFNDENAVYLNFATRGSINFVGLLLAGMLIGALGILYDAAIGQAVAVEELLRATPGASRAHLFKRAMRIGREHIGALVNTLAIAYVGVALPLLLLFQSYGDEPFLLTINREIFATEIVRAIVGSLGIVLAVPISTLVAIWLLTRIKGDTAKVQHHGNHHA